jgi:hypothetical protein
MKYYLSFVLFALLMGSVGVLLKPHPGPVPGIAMMGLFGAQHADVPALLEGQDARMPA